MSSNCCKDQEKYQQLQAVIDAKKGTEGALMPVMQEAQAIFGYLPKEVQQFIADGLGVTLSEVYGVATFYAQFVLEPQGEHVIGVCLGTACYVKGSQAVLDRLAEELERFGRQNHCRRQVYPQRHPLSRRLRSGSGHDDRR